jgi:hypothetical protein
MGLFVGAGCMIAATPSVTSREDCQTFKVKQKAVTAYVLKTPPAPPAEKVVVKEVCEPVSKKEEKINTTEERVNETDKPARHHRRHRYRRYWR